MLKKIILSTAVFTLSATSQAGLLDLATGIMGAQNGAIMDQAEARMHQSRAAANAAIARADAGYASNYNQASNMNNGVYSTSYLKTLDCTDLAVERKSFERTLNAAQQSADQANVQANNGISKFAGLAGSALSAFSGQSNTASKMSQIASSFSGKDSQQTAVSSQQAVEVAQANLDNIAIYETAKKCKI
ncbi:hypothetical protein G9F31_07120 [Acinetobacter sp. 187]|uniref:hypothetical protein n=1 Tax=Acinetobacter lanii TaxID=2715163 RepID=UPI00140E0389|nr:hypothetical protein [Acinetobacter lanii]NHC03540.1 hypothetical protein [Acinetobacter lanii]